MIISQINCHWQVIFTITKLNNLWGFFSLPHFSDFFGWYQLILVFIIIIAEQLVIHGLYFEGFYILAFANAIGWDTDSTLI